MVRHYNQASSIAVKVQSNETQITEITKVTKTGCFLPSQDRRYLIMGRTVFPVLTESLDTNKCRKDEKSVNRQGRHSCACLWSVSLFERKQTFLLNQDRRYLR